MKRSWLAVTILAVAASFALALAIAGTTTIAPRKAEATPAYTKKTGYSCKKCHTKPPKLNAFGRRFKARGHKL